MGASTCTLAGMLQVHEPPGGGEACLPGPVPWTASPTRRPCPCCCPSPVHTAFTAPSCPSESTRVPRLSLPAPSGKLFGLLVLRPNPQQQVQLPSQGELGPPVIRLDIELSEARGANASTSSFWTPAFQQDCPVFLNGFMAAPTARGSSWARDRISVPAAASDLLWRAGD